jgi:hypothetical protein
LRCFIAQRDREVRLANAGRTQQDNVFATFKKRQVEEFLDLLFWRAGSELKVELLKRLDRRKACRSRELRSSSFLALTIFGLEKSLEEILKTEFVARSFFGGVRYVIRHRPQCHALAEVADSLEFDHGAISRASIS